MRRPPKLYLNSPLPWPTSPEIGDAPHESGRKAGAPDRRAHFSAPSRVRKRYTEEQWAEIEQLGRKVDEALRRNDCRLTMGGEPTFVSVDDTDGPEWNTLALGPRKRALAEDLLKRLQRRFTAGAL